MTRMSEDLEAAKLLVAGDGDKDPHHDIDDAELDREIEELSRAIRPNKREGERRTIPPYIIIPVWIGLSACVIIFNKYIFSRLDFKYPVFLTAYHMLVATIGTRLLKLLPEGRFDRIRPAPLELPWPLYFRTIVPLAILFSASLILANVAYVHLSVSFVQMIKAFIPILTLVIQLVAGLQEYNHLLLVIILVTSIGCSIAAEGELKFSMFGFWCQCCAVIVESCRLVLIQILLKDYKMDPLASISAYAPLCFATISCCIPIMEDAAPFHNLYKVGAPLLLLNGLAAFALNVAGVVLIDSAGSLVLTLSGVCKDILLITFSVLLLGSMVTGTQVAGYAIALAGIVTFKITGGNPESSVVQRALQSYAPFGEAMNQGKARVMAVPHIRKIFVCLASILVIIFIHYIFFDGPSLALLNDKSVAEA